MTPNPVAGRLLALALLLCMPCSGQTPTPQAPPNTALQRASCVLRIENDERYGPASSSAQTLIAALTSTALIDPAMESVLKLSPTDWPSVAQVEVQPAGEAAVKLTISLKPSDRHQPAAGAARLLLNEITGRAVRSFNGEAPQDETEDTLARLRKQRTELDNKLSALRAELDTSMQLTNRRDGGNRLMVQMQIEQQIAEARIEIAVQGAAIKTIAEQLPAIEKEDDAEMKALRARLIGQRIEAQIATAKAEARVAELRKRLAELTNDSGTTQPARSAMTIQSEQAEAMNQRQQLDQQINQILNGRTNRPAKGKLVVIDGGSK